MTMSGGIYDNSTVLTAKGVRQSFDVDKEKITVLNDVNFSILANTFTVIYGPSGSGKSTLLNVIAGLQKPTCGNIKVNDLDVYGLHPDELAKLRANYIGFVHQTNFWVKSLNVVENVSLPLYALGYSRSEAAKMALIALERVKMTSYAKSYPYVLSGGEQQRIGMARAIANDPMFIIADEPTGNLDTENGDMIMNLLLNAQTEFRRTIILVTHNMEYVSLADHLLKIQDGKVEDIVGEDVRVASEHLIKDIRGRIHQLSEVKKNAVEAK